MAGLVPASTSLLPQHCRDVNRDKPGHDGSRARAARFQSGPRLVAEIRLDRAVHLDRQRVAVAVLGIAGGDADPALADAVFLDIGLLDALEANADVAREDFGIVIRAVRIDRE